MGWKENINGYITVCNAIEFLAMRHCERFNKDGKDAFIEVEAFYLNDKNITIEYQYQPVMWQGTDVECHFASFTAEYDDLNLYLEDSHV